MERMVQCLSPVHIGTGKDLEPFDYIVDGQRYRRVHLDAVLERMTPEQADDLASWVSRQADRIANLEEQRTRVRGPDQGALNERLSEIRREMQLLNFPGADAALNGTIRTDAALALYSGDRGFERNLQVREQTKDADEMPCIPGSSLKGALRTALAFVALEEMEQAARQALGQSLKKVVDQAEEEKRQGRNEQVRRLQEHIGQEIEQAVFCCGKQKGNHTDYRDIHYDLMRAFSVSDTYNAQAELIVPQIYTFVEQRTQDGRTRLDAQAPLIVEAHAPGNTFGLRLRIDVNLLRAVSRNRRRDEWISFEQRVQRAFGPEVTRLLPNTPDAQLEQAVIARLEAAARRFAKAVIVAEQRWEEKHGHGSTNALRDFYNRLDDLIGKGLVPLRLGWGSHFTNATLLLALKEDVVWRPILERCFRVFDIGVPPGPRGRTREANRQIDLDDFPRSRRLVAVGARAVAPLGWVALSPTAEGLPGPLVEKARLLIRPQRSRHRQRGREHAGGYGHGGLGPAGQSQTGPQPRDRRAAELLEEKTRKGGWKAKHIESGLQGPIQDTGNVPAGAKPGQRVQLTVASVTAKEMAFRWVEPPPPKKRAARSNRLGPGRGGRR